MKIRGRWWCNRFGHQAELVRYYNSPWNRCPRCGLHAFIRDVRNVDA